MRVWVCVGNERTIPYLHCYNIFFSKAIRHKILQKEGSIHGH